MSSFANEGSDLPEGGSETVRLRPRRTRRKRALRWKLWLPVGLGVVLIAVTAWVGARGLQAKDELTSAKSLLSEAKTKALAMDVAGATQTFEKIKASTAHSVELTRDPVWRLAEFVPVLGGNLTVTRELAAVSDLVVNRVASPLLDAASVMDPASLAPKNGTIDTKPFVAATSAIHLATAGLADAVRATDAIDTSGSIGALADARASMAALLGQLTPVVSTLDGVLPLLGPGLGADGPRNYLLVFENPAEARSLGGAALMVGLLSVDAGHVTLGSVTNVDGFPQYAAPVIAPPDGAEKLFEGAYGTSMNNATVTPSFSQAARIASEIWRQKTGVTVNGVISIDPVALSYFLTATGPITLASGDVFTDKTLVAKLLNESYLNAAPRKPGVLFAPWQAQFSELAVKMFDTLTGAGKLDVKKLLASSAKGWNEQRIQLFSADAAEETELATLRNGGGEPPASDANADRVGIYINDNVGSKLTYYLRQNVRLSQASCHADGASNYRVAIDLTNSLDPAKAQGLAPDVTGLFYKEGLDPGQSRLIVLLYAPPGSTVAGAAVNGTPIALDENHDGEHPVGKAVVTVDPGATLTLTYDVVAATPGVRALEAVVTPLVTPTKLTTEALDCATVPSVK